MDKIKVWVTKFQSRKKGNIYKVRWIHPQTGAVKTESCGKDKALAKKIESQRRQELIDGVYREIKPIGWDDFVREHLKSVVANKELGRESHKQYEFHLRRFKEICNPKGPADIDYAMLERFRNARAAECPSPYTVNKSLSYIKAALNTAVLRGHIKSSPYPEGKAAANLEMSEVDKEANPVLLDGFKAILEACPNNQWRAACTIGFYTGLREMEIVTLEWADIDLDSKIILIRSKPENLIKGRKGAPGSYDK